MYKLTDDEFEHAVSDAIDEVLDRFGDDLDNLVITVADEPSDRYPGELGSEVLGYYDGVSLRERGFDYGAFAEMPDTITVFKGPHERLPGSREDILAEVRKTVVHEVGHYFGMDEQQVDDMGYGCIWDA